MLLPLTKMSHMTLSLLTIPADNELRNMTFVIIVVNLIVVVGNTFNTLSAERPMHCFNYKLFKSIR